MQIVIAWVAGSPLLAVLVGKMIAFGDRAHADQTAGAGADTAAPIVDSRPKPADLLLGATEAAA